MLNLSDLRSLAALAQTLGYPDLRVLQEFFSQRSLVSRAKLCHQDAADFSRYHLSATGPHGTCDIVSPTLDHARVLKILTDARANQTRSFLAEQTAPMGAEKLSPRQATQRAACQDSALYLGALGRGLFANLEATAHPLLEIHTLSRTYQWWNSQGESGEGGSTQARFQARWRVRHAGRPVPRSYQAARRSLADLLTYLKNHSHLEREVETSLHPSTLWPVPEGRLPTEWSARSLAQLLEPLAAYWRTLPHSGPQSAARDLARDFPGEYALDFGADEAVVLSAKAGGAPLRALDRGVRIEQLTALAFDPQTLQSQLRVDRAQLVHAGQGGEFLEPFSLTLSLPLFLQSLDGFGDKTETLGWASPNLFRGEVLEITAPTCQSRDVVLPGTVPPEHYWDQ